MLMRTACTWWLLLFAWWPACAPLVRATERPTDLATRRQEINAHRRHIIICLDGVGFSTMEKMRAEGRFKMFREPARMISPFPTLTNLAMTDILEPFNAPPVVGYEDSFFDVEKNRLRGGIFDRLRGGRFVRGTFRELFDYHPSALKSGLGYAAPPLSTYLEALSDLVRLKQKVRAGKGELFLAYTGATDSLAHVGGERLVRSFLGKLDETLEDLMNESEHRRGASEREQSRHPSEREQERNVGVGALQITVTLFSDHGNHYRKYRRVPLKSALRRAGFKLEGRVRDWRSVVLPQFGLIGCAVLYTAEANEARLAEIVAAVEGVDFAAYEKDQTVFVTSRGGAARITRRGGRYAYLAERGDPLGLASALQHLRERGRVDGEGSVTDADWFEATRDGERPDAVRRVFEGVSGRVNNRANVIVNFVDGYYSGSAALDVFTILQATHGNLGREQSFGFVMSTNRSLPSHVRATDTWRMIGALTLNKDTHRK